MIFLLIIIKIMFIWLLTGILSASNHTKCVPLSNKKCMTQPTLNNLNLNECIVIPIILGLI